MVQIKHFAPCTLHLSHSHDDRWGATDIVTPSLHLILFSASLRALQNFNPVHLEMLLSQRLFFRPLLLPPCTVSCKIVLASPDDLDTCPNTLTCVSLLWLRYHHRAQWLAVFYCIVSDVISVWDAKQFPKASHLSGLQFLQDVRCQCPGFAGVQ